MLFPIFAYRLCFQVSYATHGQTSARKTIHLFPIQTICQILECNATHESKSLPTITVYYYQSSYATSA